MSVGYDHQVGRVARGVGVGFAGQGVSRLGFWPYDRRYVKPLLAGLLTAAPILASKQWIPSPERFPAILLFAPFILVVFFCLGLYPSDRRFLASFGASPKDTLGREPLR